MKLTHLKAFVLAAALACLVCTGAAAQAPVYAHYSPEQLIENGFQKTASNRALELYFNRNTAIVAVRIASTGYVWYSSPLDWDDDESASGFAKNTAGSLLSIRAKDARSTFRTANSIVNSVRRKGLTVEKIEGVKLIVAPK